MHSLTSTSPRRKATHRSVCTSVTACSVMRLARGVSSVFACADRTPSAFEFSVQLIVQEARTLARRVMNYIYTQYILMRLRGEIQRVFFRVRMRCGASLAHCM